ncbi:MAG: hypothetical protein MUP98_03910 [Candidatus Aminicenantes bacterium]|nr:hypothetical protein [Candidatus Aminicenantes bacterium]
MIIFIVIAALIPRATTALLNIPKACKNIYEQQYQMGLFLQRYYRHKNIAANDIGAIHYLSNAQILDLWGLSSMEVALEKRKDSFNTRVIDQITKIHQIKIAILYEHWFKTYGGLPSEWIKVGEWTIRENVICGGDTVSFYAVDPIEKESLINNLKEFSKELPKDVFQVIDGQILQ